MPENFKGVYEEARSVFPYSSRSACALLRLVVQLLCRHLGKSGENINEDIAALVRDGLSADVQRALDIVRVVGNNAVHPGQMSDVDDPWVAEFMFDLVNLIVKNRIALPAQVASF